MWHKLHRLLNTLETIFLAGLFLSLIIISVLQIIMRNLLDSGLLWADDYMRVVVLWLALIGAMVASRQTEHINIDVLNNKLPEAYLRWINRLTHMFTVSICLTLTWYSIDFVAQEYTYGGMAFSSVPIWICEAVIPFALLIISLRYIAAIFKPQND